MVWFERCTPNAKRRFVRKIEKREGIIEMKKQLIVVVGIVLAMSATGVWAQEDIIDNVMTACQPEIDAYCSQVTLGEGRLLACFYAHEDKLSGRCQYALYEGAAQLEQFAAAITHLATECMDDLEKYCAEVEQGEGRVGTCLLEHKSEVSSACAQAIDDVGLEVVEPEE
jgi:hypothetical protein